MNGTRFVQSILVRRSLGIEDSEVATAAAVAIGTTIFHLTTRLDFETTSSKIWTSSKIGGKVRYKYESKKMSSLFL